MLSLKDVSHNAHKVIIQMQQRPLVLEYVLNLVHPPISQILFKICVGLIVDGIIMAYLLEYGHVLHNALTIGLVSI